MPLFREYRTFQHFALRECYDVIRDPQKKFLTSHDFHGHSAPLGTHVDFDSVGEAIQRSDNAKIPLLYRLTDAAGRFNYITEGPEGEWENTALGRLRLCQAYAYGAVWIVPHKQGIRRDGKWLRINPEVRDLYDFIHEHRHLFDGYDDWTSVGLIYSHLNCIKAYFEYILVTCGITGAQFEVDWYPFWDAPLGKPVAAGVIEEDGSSTREFRTSRGGISPTRPRVTSWSPQDDVIEKILRHCGLWRASAPRPPPDVEGLVDGLDGCFSDSPTASEVRAISRFTKMLAACLLPLSVRALLPTQAGFADTFSTLAGTGFEEPYAT